MDLCSPRFCILFHFILFYFILIIHIIPDWIEYDVWYTFVLIDYLRVIHMTISFQVILCQIS